MTPKKQSAEKMQTLLEEITEGFERTIFHQHNLLAIPKNTTVDHSTLEALLIGIDRLNDDLFRLYERLRDLVEFEASKGVA